MGAALDRALEMLESERSTIGSLKTADDRIHYVVGLMSRNEWVVSYTFRKRLSEIWGVSISSVYNYASQAHRMLSMDPEERDQLKRMLAARFEEIAQRAKTTFSTVTGMPDFRAEIDAIKLYAEYSGVTSAEDAGKASDTQPVRVVVTYEDKHGGDAAGGGADSRGETEPPAGEGPSGAPA